MITQARLKELLHYYPCTGAFVWRTYRNWRARAGDVAGGEDNAGYRKISMDGTAYYSHRLACLYMTGSWPKAETDHINHVRNDNRWKNLRDVSHRENGMNKAITVKNTSGIVGVAWHKTRRKWLANIMVEKKAIYLGLFEDFEEAAKARKEAEKKYGFHRNHGIGRRQ